MKLKFYTRKQCPLCEDAKLVLLALQKEFDFELVERDIETNDEWMERFALMIPVVECEDEIVQYGIIDPFTIEEKLFSSKN